MRHVFSAAVLISFFALSAGAQSSAPSRSPSRPAISDSVPLVLPKGMPLQIVLEKQVHIRKEGQPVEGKIAEPVYAFDKLVIPAGSDVKGKVLRIRGVGTEKRILSLTNANLSPAHQIQIEFDELDFADGRRLPLKTFVSPSSAGVMELVSADPGNPNAKGHTHNRITRKISESRAAIRQEWNVARRQMHEPGKMHRLEHYGILQLPYHPQYIEAGTRFDAELLEPLSFGTESFPPQKISALGSAPPAGASVNASLMTPLNSATSVKGDEVEARVMDPVYAGSKLLIPEGSLLKGSVLQARPARRLGRNGQLRIIFHQIVPPDGVTQQMEGALQGVEVPRGEHLSLDSEGGAEVITPRTRYLTTGISVALAATSFSSDQERGGTDPSGDPGNRAANGGMGLRAIGLISGTLVHSRALASGLGVYGAALAVYTRFLMRGREVVYPRDMRMAIELGPRDAAKPQPIRPTASGAQNLRSSANSSAERPITLASGR